MFKNTKYRSLALVFGVFLITTGSAWAAPDWPADSGQEIGLEGEESGLPDGFEPSGSVWHPVRQSLIVVDDSGFIVELDPALGVLASWEMDEDLEGVTLANPDDGLVYLAVEDPDGVIEFSLTTGTATGETWDLTPWLEGPDNHGLEAITYVDGLFYTGLQEDGNIFIFNLISGGVVQHLGTIAPHNNRDDLSGLHFDACTETLYAIHDSHDVIVEMTAAGNFLREYNLVGDNQEGVAIIGGSSSGQTTIFIAQDSGEVWMYDQYTIDPCDAHSAIEEFPASWLNNLQCRPNPFNPSTELSFELNKSGPVSLRIFNVAGQCLQTLIDRELETGSISVSWNGKDFAGQTLSSGVYFARLVADGAMQTTKLVMTK